MNNLKKATLWATLLSLILKLSGVLRESILAKEFGASAETTAYYLAFSFITIVIAMIATGFNNVFLPMYIKEQQDKRHFSDQNATGLLNITMLIFVILSFTGWYKASLFVPIIFPGMSNAVEPIALEISKLFFLFMSVIVLSALLDSYLQARRIFVPSQIAKLSATFMAAIFALLFSEVWGIISAAYGFIIGTVLGTVIQLVSLIKSNYNWSPTFKMSPDFRKAFIVLLIPALLNSVVGQVNMLVNKAFAASTFDEAVTYLNNASMIINIPTAIYAATLVTIIFTLMSEQVNNDKEFKETFFSGMELSLITLLPIAIGLLVIGDYLVALLYERGKFTSEDSYGTYQALIWYVPIIVFQGLQLILSKSMYARGKTNVVFRISVLTIAINFLLNWIFVERYGYLVLAFSASVVSIYYCAASMIVVYKDIGISEFKRFARVALRILISSVIMGATVFFSKEILNPLNLILKLPIIVLIGMTVYIICVRFLYSEGYFRLIHYFNFKK